MGIRRDLARLAAALREAEAVGTAGYEAAFVSVGLDPGEWVLVRAEDWIGLLMLVDELAE